MKKVYIYACTVAFKIKFTYRKCTALNVRFVLRCVLRYGISVLRCVYGSTHKGYVRACA